MVDKKNKRSFFNSDHELALSLSTPVIGSNVIKICINLARDTILTLVWLSLCGPDDT